MENTSNIVEDLAILIREMRYYYERKNYEAANGKAREEIAASYQAATSDPVPASVPAPTPTPQPEAPAVVKKPRKPRTPKVVEEAPKAEAVPLEETLKAETPKVEKELTEEESAAEAVNVAKVFVKRFEKSTPDGLTMARAILKDLGVERISMLTHPLRLTFIKRVNDAIASAEGAKEDASVLA